MAENIRRRRVRTQTQTETGGVLTSETEVDGLTAPGDMQGPEDVEVTVVVPEAFTLHRDDGNPVNFPAGVQEMKLVDANHWYARARGVKVYARQAEANTSAEADQQQGEGNAQQ